MNNYISHDTVNVITYPCHNLSWFMQVKGVPGVLGCKMSNLQHDDVIKWRYFPRYWPFVRGIHRSPVNSPQKSQWRGALMFCSICVWINGWVNNREAGDLRRYRAHYDVIAMNIFFLPLCHAMDPKSTISQIIIYCTQFLFHQPVSNTLLFFLSKSNCLHLTKCINTILQHKGLDFVVGSVAHSVWWLVVCLQGAYLQGRMGSIVWEVGVQIHLESSLTSWRFRLCPVANAQLCTECHKKYQNV